ncbi:FeoA family protein [Clostridium gasigenes]|uniref:Ferrous iron transport protein A n=1 Tax=Clostridium gasigenes TaxID=94869 RepID=A0A1H0VZB9_9CLOT|nr:FeoA family protein [Clostridium gasigenes]MBB6625429.1 ferrous iron transport protein A [Clostridium gasigenes]MBU3089935.1 ferrous iron transport protein A [Clostridium gasigenes]MBU3105059.1 ferrous iron transport protein A [Clostridium gasigenes]MBU3107507.1 ferrous iron transport protein A [Clostridium gasigenes]MBU3131896.1 ferrous iron transport protein A [Clostridium gasigenes]
MIRANRTLNSIKLNDTAKVTALIVDGELRRRFLDLGIINGTEIRPLYASPLGDPTAYLIRGTVIAIREDEARFIQVTNC